MSIESEIPTTSAMAARRFAIRLSLFYAAIFSLMGAHLPFFPLWLKAIGTDAGWIGVIVAVPSATRFTVLPLVTGFAGRQRSLRGVLIALTLLTMAGFCATGLLRGAVVVLIAFAVTACAWTPILPLTESYALQGVSRHRLHYGPLRLWGSIAFVAGTLGAGVVADRLAPAHLIWVMVALAGVGAALSLCLRPLPAQVTARTMPSAGLHLLRQRGFIAVIAAAALIQGSHAAYYSFASIAWQEAGYGGATIAVLWVLGVLAEIVLFAMSPRFALPPVAMMAIGAASGVVRWLITALEPSLPWLAAIQLLHALTYGMTLLGTMALLVRLVPGRAMTQAQGYLTAVTGLVMSGASVASGLLYARDGTSVYWFAAAMAAAGGIVIWIAWHHLKSADQPHNRASGG
jgi:PPP family 3-phenylpropionic acid transporter